MKLRHVPFVILLVLAPGIAGCSCCGAFRMCMGEIDLRPKEPPPPRCVTEYAKCLEGCKGKADDGQKQACQDVCASEKRLCEQPPTK